MTDYQQLLAWVEAGESEIQEFKLSTGQRTEAMRALCAFLNHRGGRVLFGVDAHGVWMRAGSDCGLFRVDFASISRRFSVDFASISRPIPANSWPMTER